MKSKICLCNGTVLRKDLTRFAPLLLGTGLLLWFVGWSFNMTYDLAREEIGMGELPFEPVSIFLMLTNLLGLVSAVCLFGYLTKKKECDAMHALPVRRETFFLTHCLAALIFFAVPYGILYGFMPGLRGWGFQMGFSFLGWLFYFGLAVFSMMLAGRRLGGLMIFWLLSDLVSSVWSMVATLYIPQLPGLYLDSETALTLTPSTHMMTIDFMDGTLGELLLPMGLYALGGLVLLTLALLIYRKRKLERAGDFLAEKWLEPVFAWGLGISGACIFVSLGYAIEASVWVPLILGLAIGYFAARMLFARSVKVFNKGSLIGFAALVAVMAVSVGIVSADPFGVVKKVPELAQIESVSVAESEFIYNLGGSMTVTDPEQIEQIRTMHREIVEQEDIPESSLMDLIHNEYTDYYLTYTLTDGSELKRCYKITQEDHFSQIEYLMSQPEHLVGTDNIELLLARTSELEAYGTGGGMIHTRRNFFQVFLKDCEAGNMYRTDYEDHSAWSVSMYLATPDGGRTYVNIDIPSDAVDTIAWLEDYFH